jgi:regulatory Fis family protein
LPNTVEPLTSTSPRLKSADVIAINEVASALVSTDPVDQVGRMLSRLLEHAKASGGAVVVPGHDSPRVMVARNVALPNLESLPTLWQRHEKSLRTGRPFGKDDQRLLPLLDGSDLIGAVYVEGPDTETHRVKAFQGVLARAVLAATDPEALRAFGADLLGVGVERSKREITLASLRQHEWNISRVARELGLTRRTIYLRLTRWGINRERVLKTARRIATEGV